jgi:hypothetical protein
MSTVDKEIKNAHPPKRNGENVEVFMVNTKQMLQVDPKETLAAEYRRNINFRPNYSRTKAVITDMCPLFGTKQALWKCRESIALRYTVVGNHRLCCHCLGTGHRVSSDRINPKQLCGTKGCTRFHHKLLHPSKKSTVLYDDRDS